MISTNQTWRKAVLPSSSTIGQAISNLDQTAIKIVLVVNDAGELEGTISDGDIRRSLLKGLDLRSPITTVVHRNPLVVPPNMGRDLVRQLMATNKIHQIPVVDQNNHVVDLHLWDEVAVQVVRSNLMVIMAGGMGKRLLPHTENCPKPLLSVAGKPMLEHIIERAKLEGFSRFVLSVNYLGFMIKEHFGNGSPLGVQIDYIWEQNPLGTAGALSLLNPRPNEAFVVTNGDVITDIRYGELIDFHHHQNAAATMAVRVHEWQNPFGVVKTQGVEIIGFEEKPVVRAHINAGVYVLEPDVLNCLMTSSHCDMPTVFERLNKQAKRTVAYPMYEPWLDIGRLEDLKLASSQLTNLTQLQTND